MISVTDRTLLESQGNFEKTCEIMEGSGPSTWMLRTTASISHGPNAFNYTLHFYNSGEVHIVDLNRPLTLDIPDDDLRQLFEWCTSNGWNRPILHKDLARDHRAFQFWMRMYNAGLIDGEEFREQEEEDKIRFSQIATEEEADGA